MLKFTDNQNIEHVFNLENLVHVHVRKSDEKNVTLTMHTLGPHTIPLTVDSKTANYVLSELGEHHATKQRTSQLIKEYPQ